MPWFQLRRLFFRAPAPSERSFMIGKLLFFPLCEGDDTLREKKIATRFFFLCGGSFRDVDLGQRAFSRRHQFDVYCIKRGRAWPRENIKASSISLEKKKNRWTKIHYTRTTTTDGKVPLFSWPRGTGQRRWKETIPVQFRSILLFSSWWVMAMVRRIFRR